MEHHAGVGTYTRGLAWWAAYKVGRRRLAAIGGNHVRLLGSGRRFRTCVPCRLLRQQAVTAHCSPSWPTLPCLLRTQVWRNDVDATPAVRLLATAASPACCACADAAMPKSCRSGGRPMPRRPPTADTELRMRARSVEAVRCASVILRQGRCPELPRLFGSGVGRQAWSAVREDSARRLRSGVVCLSAALRIACFVRGASRRLEWSTCGASYVRCRLAGAARCST